MEILDTASSPENAVHFSDAEIAIIMRALTTKLFRRATETLEVRLPKFQVMFTELSEVFGIPEVKITTGPVRQMGYAAYDPATNTVETEQHLSLVTVLHGFASALKHHKPEFQEVHRCDCGQGSCATAQVEERAGLNANAFALSAFKQAAPEMFEDAKGRGRLWGTGVEYTDDGRLTAERHAQEDAAFQGEDAPPEGSTQVAPPPPAAPSQRADVDPENLKDRGNGRGED